jgi:hypothetical protein
MFAPNRARAGNSAAGLAATFLACLTVAAALRLPRCSGVPLAIEAGKLLSPTTTRGDHRPRIAARVRSIRSAHEIEAALKAGDADLARSFVELADDRQVDLPSGLRQRVEAAVVDANSASSNAMNFARGLITGEPDDVVSLAGTALGDLFVFGDIRDVVREGSRYAHGETMTNWCWGSPAPASRSPPAPMRASGGDACPGRAVAVRPPQDRQARRADDRLGRASLRDDRLECAAGERSVAEPASRWRGARGGQGEGRG